MDEVVDQFALSNARFTTNQVGTTELIVAMDQADRTTQLRGDVERQGGLPCACRAGKVNCVAGLQISQGALSQLLDVGREDELIAGLGQDAIVIGRIPEQLRRLDF